MTTIRNQYFDVIRGIAILGVVAVHSSQQARIVSGGSDNALVGLATLGRYGVELFFFISGSLMVSLYGGSRGFASSRSQAFWPKRLARIVPLWLVFFAINMAFLTSTPWGASVETFLAEHQSPGGMFAVIALTATFSAWLSPLLWNSVVPGGWSIQAEMFHYLAFYLGRKWKALTTLLLLCCINLSTLALIYIKSFLPGPLNQAATVWIEAGFYSTLFYFLLGAAAIGLVKKFARGAKMADAIVSLTWFEGALAVLYLATVLMLPLPFGSNVEAIGFVGTCLAVGALLQRIPLVVSALVSIGKYSYFLYFMHFFVIAGLTPILNNLSKARVPFLGSITIDLFLYIFAIFLISMPLAWLSFRFFESPILRLAHRLT